MPEHTFDARIQSKYDTYPNWMSENPILLEGEMVAVTFPDGMDGFFPSNSVLFKVGNGTDHFMSLPFVSAFSADIYSWAKEDHKPSYSTSEISGLNDSLENKVSTIQGTANAGKVLGISADGTVTPVSTFGSGALTWGDLKGTVN